MKRLLLIIWVMLFCFNSFADEVIDDEVNVTWALDDNLTITDEGIIDISDEDDDGIDADDADFWIKNYGSIIADAAAIFADSMIGSIYNYESASIYAEKYGIYAYKMKGSIYNYASIDSDETGIYANTMVGNIYNYAGDEDGIYGYSYGIYAISMTGNIYNYENGDIEGYAIGIYANSMTGNIYNSGWIYGDDEYGIDARSMSGDIYNYASGEINSFNGYGIDATLMVGDIYNYGTIEGQDDSAIHANSMTGDIYNYGTIISPSTETVSINVLDFTGTIYNYGTIEGHDEDEIAILGKGILNIVGNGTIIGKIVDDDGDGTLNLTNDIDGTVLDLRQSRLAQWETINLLGGEMIITMVGFNDVINQTGANTYIHLGTLSRTRRFSLDYNLAAGVLNLYDEDTPYKSLRFNSLNVNSGATLEMNFGLYDLNDRNSDRITFFNGSGYVADGAILRLLPGEILDPGQYEYTLFEDTEFDSDLIIEIPLLYTLDDVSDDQYDYTISRNDESYTKYANSYNRGFASLLNSTNNEDADDTKLELEQALTVDAFNAVLEPYNMAGYASLANNNVNYINQRVSQLYGRLNASSNGAGGNASNTTIGSSYATANPGVKRDANGNIVWFDVYMSDNTLDGEDGYELESNGYEVAIGIDTEINADMILGLALHYSDYNADVTGGLPVDIDTKGFGLSLYGQYKQDKLTHKAIIGFTDYSNDASRAGADADFDSNEFYVAYRVEYLIKKESCDIVPIAGLTYSHITYDDIVEDGGVNGLEGYDYDSLQTELGVKLVKQLNALGLNVGISWIHELMDTESDAKGTSEFGSYDQNGIERDEDILRASLGVDYQLNDSISLGLLYAKEFGENTDSDSIEATISFSF